MTRDQVDMALAGYLENVGRCALRTIELYGDDRTIDRVVERTYARHPASSTKRGAARRD